MAQPKKTRRPRNVAAGSPEHIERVRAPLLSQIKELQAQLEEATKLAAHHDAERRQALDLRAQANNAAREAVKERDAVINECNGLRGQIRQLELDCERMRGYLDGIEDSKPPKLVEEPRVRRFGRYAERETNEIHNYVSVPHQWYERR